jgi:tetratricopeptide (TPR) repeat protein
MNFKRNDMRFLAMVLVVIITACTQMTSRKTIDESKISPIARQKLEDARALIRKNQPKPALSRLAELNDNNLSEVEKALKYNLKGVILFNLNEIEKSVLNFEVAEKYTPKDTQLFSQVQLNMASGYFRMNKFTQLKNHLDKIDKRHLTSSEKKKYSQLALAYGIKFENPPMIVSSSVTLMDELKTFDEVSSSNLFEGMKESFKKMTPGQKIELLEEFNDSENLAIAYLAQLETEDRYMAGDKDGAKDVVSWLRSEFGSLDDVKKFIKDFEFRLENSYRISSSEIGVVLPLTGAKASFGQKALSGVDTGLKILGLNDNVKVHIKDSLDSPAQAAQAVQELIRSEKVAFIIGGLFPESAKAEYQEAKKYGVLYISLSQINLPIEEKNHNLIEIQGSIESQVETLLSDKMIQKFGKRLGVIFPDNEGGRAYVDEIWRKANQKNVKVTSIAAFPKNTHDFRETAQLFLGLKYPRERSEEFALLEDVYSHEKTSIRRVQTLPPVVDFDWVFLASYPYEAAQLIPTLGYYDANRLKVVGGPSWVSKSMVKEQKNLGTLYFVGDDPKDLNLEMLNKFQEIYGKPASLIEILALDAMKLGAEILNTGSNTSSRDDFDSKLKSKGKLQGLATFWEFKDGIWLKEMNPMTITRGDIVKLFDH